MKGKHACFERSADYNLIEVESIKEYCMQTYALERARDHCYGPVNFANCINSEIAKATAR